ncbi:MAG: Flp pilus assembly protein CpaB [Candidatus Omnitrophica bacterium]|nr:Flp pilus assembly protein CpaB [Candidatus Omnitrophota bacterium]MCF7894763.1 Flp pilus assembly protein CpaB [Candidatus Omnitrophota bacterium]MCF7917152.1 Flp pilus assembly protein CpaB [Candidatus Omnitrophota bacterium]
MDKKKLINLGIGVILAIIAIVIINARLQERERIIQRLVQEGNVAQVLVASRDIKKGGVIRENMLGFIKIRSERVKPNALQSPESAVGKVARVDILKKQEILSTMVKLPEGSRSLSEKTPPGKKAYTISIDKISAVGGNIKNGDRVDVVGIMQLPQTQGQTVMTLFEGAKVLQTGGGGKNLESITLALSSEQIRVLTFSLQNGKVKLVLRSPRDETGGGAFQPFTYQTFMQKIYNAMGIQPQEGPVQQKEPYVEIYRGGILEEQ